MIARPGAADRAFLGIAAVLFAASVAGTIVWCGSMAARPGMPMPGDWSMSMAWMRMPGQTWPAAAASFLGMWTLMMVAMMLPSLVPMLWHSRQSAGEPGLSGLVVGLGYFSVWAGFGAAVFPMGVALATIAMQQPSLARAVPLGSAVVVLIVGGLQFTAWKARQLACCRADDGRAGTAASAWRRGLRLGVDCTGCCGNLMALLVVIGLMNLGVMAAVTVAITAERLGPSGARTAHAIGVVVVIAGLVLAARASGLG